MHLPCVSPWKGVSNCLYSCSLSHVILFFQTSFSSQLKFYCLVVQKILASSEGHQSNYSRNTMLLLIAVSRWVGRRWIIHNNIIPNVFEVAFLHFHSIWCDHGHVCFQWLLSHWPSHPKSYCNTWILPNDSLFQDDIKQMNAKGHSHRGYPNLCVLTSGLLFLSVLICNPRPIYARRCTMQAAGALVRLAYWGKKKLE